MEESNEQSGNIDNFDRLIEHGNTFYVNEHIARQLGLVPAMLLENIKASINFKVHNRDAYDHYFMHGHWWSKQTVSEFEERFKGIVGRTTIKAGLDKLIEAGLVHKAQLSKWGTDQANFYHIDIARYYELGRITPSKAVHSEALHEESLRISEYHRSDIDHGVVGIRPSIGHIPTTPLLLNNQTKNQGNRNNPPFLHTPDLAVSNNVKPPNNAMLARRALNHKTLAMSKQASSETRQAASIASPGKGAHSLEREQQGQANAKAKTNEAITATSRNLNMQGVPMSGSSKTKPTARQTAAQKRDAKYSLDLLREINELWNTVCGAKLGRTRVLTPARMKAMRACFEQLDIGGLACTVELWAEVFGKVMESEFLCGGNDRGWRACFDWVVCDARHTVKILEGGYGGKAKLSTNKYFPISTMDRIEGNIKKEDVTW